MRQSGRYILAAALLLLVIVLTTVTVVLLVRYGARRPHPAPPTPGSARDGGTGSGWGAGSASDVHPAPAAMGDASEALRGAVAASLTAHAFAGRPVAADPRMRVQVVENSPYTVGFSNERREPLWVAYTLPPRVTLETTPRPAHQKFAADTRTDASVRHDDYTGTGYDRGHMAPSSAIGKWFGADAQITTFLTSNICPQRHPLNDGDWGGVEALEEAVYPRQFGQVWVLAGPIFEGAVSTIGPGIAVPTAFYKIIVRVDDRGFPHALALVMPQEDPGLHTLRGFATTVRSVEERSGLDFFTGLPGPEQDALETAPAGEEWGLDTPLDDNRIRRKSG